VTRAPVPGFCHVTMLHYSLNRGQVPRSARLALEPASNYTQAAILLTAIHVHKLYTDFMYMWLSALCPHRGANTNSGRSCTPSRNPSLAFFALSASRLPDLPRLPCRALYRGGGSGPLMSTLPTAGIHIFVRFEVFTAVTMKNVVFWDIRSQFVLHRRHITSPLQSPAG
jgi:hypothetical protein